MFFVGFDMFFIFLFQAFFELPAQMLYIRAFVNYSEWFGLYCKRVVKNNFFYERYVNKRER